MSVDYDALKRRDALKHQLFEAALMHAAFDGWSSRTLRHAAADLGLDQGDTARLFPHGSSDLLDHLSPWLDEKLEQAASNLPSHEHSRRDRICDLVLLRLDPLQPHKETFCRALAAKLIFPNSLKIAPSLWRTAELVLRLAATPSDTSIATRPISRLTLAGLIASTTLYWLQDQSPNNRATRRFLERRLDMAVRNTRRLRATVTRLRLPGSLASAQF